jgi:cobalt-zinc-cadmium resistance protein CzcA
VLDKLIDFAVHRRAITLTATLLLAIFGVVTFGKLKIEAFPDVTNVQVMVITLYPGQAAEEIEKQVTIPVERALTGTPRVLIQRSITSFGLSQVILTFEDDVDIYWARSRCGAAPDAEVRRASSHTSARTTRRSGRSTSTRWRATALAQRAAQLAGLGRLEAPDARARASPTSVSFGGFQKEWHVLADPSSCATPGITLKDVIDAVAASNGATSGGYLQLGESSWSCAAAATCARRSTSATPS